MRIVPPKSDDSARRVLARRERMVEASDAISAWLDVFVRLLRFPEAERAGVREELESHLRERVRDLVLTDVSEVEAQRRAIAELGDSAELAQRYVAAKRTPTRRLVMNGLVAVAAGAALITSLVAVNHAPPPGSRSVEYQPPLAAVAGESSGNKVAAHSFEKTPLREVFAAVAADLGKPLTLNEAALGQVNIDMAVPVTLRLEAGDLNAALKRINSALADHQGTLDWRVTAAQLEVATREHFDAQETRLISMELGNYFSTPQATPQAVVQLVSQMVEPDGWMENGGNTSRMSVVGQKLFVKAPPRVVAQVAWIVDRLNDVGDKPAAAANADREMQAALRRRAVDEERARLDEAVARKHRDDAEQAARDVASDLELKRRAEADAAARADMMAQTERKRRADAEAAAGAMPGADARPRQSGTEALPGTGTPMPKQNHTPGSPGDGALAPLPRGGKSAGSAAPAAAMPGLTGGATAAPAPRGGGKGLAGTTAPARPAVGGAPSAGANPALPGSAPTADPRSGGNNPAGAAPAMPAASTSDPSGGGPGNGNNPTGNPPAVNPPATAPSSEPSGLVYLEGKVDRPGVYSLSSTSQVTLKRLLTASGGVNDSATSVKIIRGVSTDAKVFFQATPAQLREVTAEDPVLTRDDRVQVE